MLVRVLLAGLVSLLGSSRQTEAQVLPLGGQLEVNTYTTGTQSLVAAAAHSAGGFVIVWQSVGSDGSDTGSYSIQGQRYGVNGAPAGGQFQVNTYTTNGQHQPAVAVDGTGGFIVVWTSFGAASDTDFASVQAQRYDASGAPVGGQFQVNTYTTGTQVDPDVAIDGAGNFVVTWASSGSAGTDASSLGVQARLYDASAAPLGPEFQVNSYTTDIQHAPAVATDAAGNFVVVWTSRAGDGTDTFVESIQAQRFDAAGTPLGSQFQVNTYTTNHQDGPDVVSDPAGNFVALWSSAGGSGTDPVSRSVQGQRYDASGAPVGGEFQVNTYTTGGQYVGGVATDGAGNFLVVWSSNGSAESDADGFSAQGQRYDASWTPVGGQFQVNTYTTGHQEIPVAAIDAAGSAVVAWVSNGSATADVDLRSIQAQRYVLARPVLGRRLLVKDPSGSEQQRTVIVLGREASTDIGPTILGDPTTAGATLRVIANGTVPSDQTYVLDAAGWVAIGTKGFKYLGPTGADDDPVRKVLVKRTPAGTALVKVILKGSVGSQSLDVVPPSPGDAGGIILAIAGGGTYCANFGGAAGGTETNDTGQLWKITNATGQGCPTP
jgi:hypothetical protein